MADDGKYDEPHGEPYDGKQADDAKECAGESDDESAEPSTDGKYRGFRITYWTQGNKEHAEAVLRTQARKAQYLVAGLEWAPTTGKEHFQTYIYYKNKRSLNNIRNLFLGHDVRPANKTPQENKKYCTKTRAKDKKKNDYVIEIGDLPAPGTRADIDAAKQMILGGASMREVALGLSETFVKYHSGLEKLRGFMMNKKRTHKTIVIVLWGDAGTGKTMTAESKGAALVKYTPSGFTQGYDYQEVVYLDEMDDTLVPRGQLLQYMDRYQNIINIKGGEKHWAPLKMYITSNKDPRHWYGGDMAVKRRLDHVYHLTTVAGKTVFTDQTPEYDELRRLYTSMPTEDQMSQIP